MYRVVEPFGDLPVEVMGVTLPTPAIVDSDEDGERLLIMREDPTHDRVFVPARAWASAHASGVAAIVLVAGDGCRWLLSQRFMALREEDPAMAAYSVPLTAFGGPTEVLPDVIGMWSWSAEQQGDASPATFVPLHVHSEFSALDGLSTILEIVESCVRDGSRAVGLTDHGTCAGHPALERAATEAGIKPIFGIEANFTDDRFRRGESWEDEDGKRQSNSKEVLADYTHLCLWAMDDEGLRNLWAMSTEANRDGFYGRPRMDWETLERYAEGVIASTACLRGPIARDLLEGRREQATMTLARLMRIFKDRLYIEIQTNQTDEQRRLNPMLIEIAREHDLPIIAATDSHYHTPEDKDPHRAWIAVQTDKELQDDADLFQGQHDYHMLSEKEVRAALGYLSEEDVEEAIATTATLAQRCDAEIPKASEPPIFSRQGGAEADVDRLVRLCISNWERKVGRALSHSQEEYEERFEREMALLTRKHFSGYFLMVADYVRWAKEHNILVGPGRGSGGGSLVAYLADITEVDPVEHDLLFERFLTEGRKALPDFDLDFPTSKRDVLTRYAQERWGEDHVVRVGTHLRVKNKGVIRTLARTLKQTMEIDYADIDRISRIIDAAEASTAGLGLSWDELWAQEADLLEPWREQYPLLFDLAERFVGRLKSYGKHPAGLIISTERNLTDSLPLRYVGANEPLVTEHDMDALESMGLVKFDLLTLRTLDTVQMTIDMVEEHTGHRIDIYSDVDWGHEQMWDEIGEGHTLGIFQIETNAGTRMMQDLKPRSIEDLADGITLVRPGPMRSGLTDQFLRRRRGEEPIDVPDERMKDLLSSTYGCLIYQEDILATCMTLGGYDSTEADAVRKMLGKKQVEQIEEAGEKFVAACAERGMEPQAAETLWQQMAEFARYSFGKAHAVEYALIGGWTAWLRTVWTPYYLAAALSTVDKDRIPVFVNEARRSGYRILPPDVNESGSGFRVSGDATAVRYGLDSIDGIGASVVEAVTRAQPYTSFDDFLARRGGACNSGHIQTLIGIGAFDSLYPHRRALETYYAESSAASHERCVFMDEQWIGPNGLPCVFDWESEPALIGRSGKPLKQKPPPKRCTKRCRNYTPRLPPSLDEIAARVEPYSDAEIRQRERDVLGVWLSSTPFDAIPDDLRSELLTGQEAHKAPLGQHKSAGVILRVKPHTTRQGKAMGFVDWETDEGEMSTVVFPEQWERFKPLLRKETFALFVVTKNDRGLALENIVPI